MSNRIGKKTLFGLDGEIFENNSSIMQGESNGLFVEKKNRYLHLEKDVSVMLIME